MNVTRAELFRKYTNRVALGSDSDRVGEDMREQTQIIRHSAIDTPVSNHRHHIAGCIAVCPGAVIAEECKVSSQPDGRGDNLLLTGGCRKQIVGNRCRSHECANVVCKLGAYVQHDHRIQWQTRLIDNFAVFQPPTQIWVDTFKP